MNYLENYSKMQAVHEAVWRWKPKSHIPNKHPGTDTVTILLFRAVVQLQHRCQLAASWTRLLSPPCIPEQICTSAGRVQSVTAHITQQLTSIFNHCESESAGTVKKMPDLTVKIFDSIDLGCLIVPMLVCF